MDPNVFDIPIGIQARNTIAYQISNLMHSTYHFCVFKVQNLNNYAFPVDFTDLRKRNAIKQKSLGTLYTTFCTIKSHLNSLFILFFPENLNFVTEEVFGAHLHDIYDYFDKCTLEICEIENFPPQQRLSTLLTAQKRALVGNLRIYRERLRAHSMFGQNIWLNVSNFVYRETHSLMPSEKEIAIFGPKD